MELFEALRERKSIRAFLPDAVPKDVVGSIIHAGITAPSKGNSQIWEFLAVTGEKKKELAGMLLDLLKKDFIPAMQMSDAGEESVRRPAVRKAEQRGASNKEELSKVLLPLGLSVEDFMLEGTFTFFGAPVAVLVLADEGFAGDLPHILSIGAAVQNMLLAATALGLGACWIGGVWRYTKQIRSLLGIDPSKKLLSSIALGYPDPCSPVNKYRASRDDMTDFVQWVGFDHVTR